MIYTGLLTHVPPVRCGETIKSARQRVAIGVELHVDGINFSVDRHEGYKLISIAIASIEKSEFSELRLLGQEELRSVYV